MSARPEVSIITPTYNHAQFIGTCISSVLSQSYRNWEQVILDDGSTDSTEQIVGEHTDPRIKYIRRDHEGIGGLGRAYNAALQESTGRLVAILEGDDCWPPDKLETEVPLFRSKETVLCWGNGRVMDAEGKPRGHIATLKQRGRGIRLRASDLVPEILLTNFIAPASGVVLRRELLNRIGGFCQSGGVPYVDWTTWLCALREMQPNEQFAYVNHTATWWRIHREQVSTYRGMVISRARVANQLMSGFELRASNETKLTQDMMQAIVSYHRARAALVESDWRNARRYAQLCWGTNENSINARALILTLGAFMRMDSFRMFPLYIQYRVPRVLRKFVSGV